MSDSPRPDTAEDRLPLRGLRVIDASNIFAGPLIGALLADFGADVIKIEHPSAGDPIRAMGYAKDGVPLWYKVTNRGKRNITLNLGKPRGQELFRELASKADVVIENYRVGTMERWGIGWETLHALNPRLVMVRVTGFGQTGPYRQRPGFGTLAEAMSGMAHLTGDPDGPPMLPPYGLADAVAAQYGTWATMFALYERDAQGSGEGQYIDLSIYEPMFALLGYQPTLYDQLGIIQRRTGNRSDYNAPRNSYQTKDGRWVAVSAASPSIVERVMRLTGGEAAVNDPRFQTAESRVEHVAAVDDIVGGWIARHTLDEVLAEFERTEAAIAPIYDIEQILADPQYQAREDVISVPDDELGSLRMQNAFPYLSATPGRVSHAGRAKGADNDALYNGELGLDDAALAALREEGVI